jgi:SAM-dependent methyltransferase
MRRFWNARAREDAAYFVDTRRPYRQAGGKLFTDAEELVDFVLHGLGAELRAGDTVLEIGCGVGRMTRVLASRAAAVIALDVSDEMLAQARELGPDLTNVSWVLGDGTSLAGIEDAGVDACFSTVVFQHLPDPELTLGYVREVGRVLRRGGWAALQVSNDPSVHIPRDDVRGRLKSVVGRAPKGQTHPAWLGSAVELPAVREAAAASSLRLDRVWGEGSQYCQLLLRKAAPAPPSGAGAGTAR